MASSKVVVVSTNPDLPRAPSSSSSIISSFLLSSHFHHLPQKNTTTMDEILKNIYPAAIEAASKQQQQSTTSTATTTNNNIDDVWRDILAGGGTDHHDHKYKPHYHPSSDEGFSTYGSGGDEVTLEDFLVRAGAVPGPGPSPFSPHQYPSSSSEASHSLPVATVKRKAVDETLELDKAALQKQKRMIKNRESAARSRERKQAYTTELESQVKRLEIENKELLEEQVEMKNLKLKMLKEFVIPVTEQRRPKKKLRRLNSL